MLDFEQQANQAQALASLDEDWHLLEGERTTFAIFLLVSLFFAFIYIWIIPSMLNRCILGKNLYWDRHFVNTGARYLNIYIHCIYYYPIKWCSKLIEFKKRKITLLILRCLLFVYFFLIIFCREQLFLGQVWFLKHSLIYVYVFVLVSRNT